MSQRITVKNDCTHDISVRIAEQRTVLVETSDSSSSSSNTSIGVERSQNAGVEVEGFGVEGGSSTKANFSHAQSASAASSRKYDHDAFVKAGAAKIPPSGTHVYDIEKSSYYLSVGLNDGTFWHTNVPKNAILSSIYVKPGGTIEYHGAAIGNGAEINLMQTSSNKSISAPRHFSGLWHVANGDDSAATHVVSKVSGGGDLKDGDIVRITAKHPLENDRKYLYHGAHDNCYYEWDANDTGCHWRIAILNDEMDTKTVRHGTRMQLKNVRWGKSLTVDLQPDFVWVKSMSVQGADTHWRMTLD